MQDSTNSNWIKCACTEFDKQSQLSPSTIYCLVEFIKKLVHHSISLIHLYLLGVTIWKVDSINMHVQTVYMYTVKTIFLNEQVFMHWQPNSLSPPERNSLWQILSIHKMCNVFNQYKVYLHYHLLFHLLFNIWTQENNIVYKHNPHPFV